MPIKQLQLQCAVDNEITPHNQQTPNHVLHALVSLFMIGMWIPIWIIVAIGASHEPAVCVKCGNRRAILGAATVSGPVAVKPTSAKQWIVAAVAIGAVVLAVIAYGLVSGEM